MHRAVLILLALLLSRVAFAQDPRAASPPERPAATDEREDDPPNQEARERVATAATILLALVAFIGLALLALVMFWGYRTRRIARTPLPPARQPDPFWYLRPGKDEPKSEDEPS